MILFTDKHRIPFQIDEADYEAVSRYYWHIAVKGYPTTNIGRREQARQIRLHHFLLGRAPAGLEWDHINRDKLDNRRANLRAVTASENRRNTDLRSDSKSGVTGVCWASREQKWQAYINVNWRRRHIGYFDSVAAAASARQAAEGRYWRKRADEGQR